MQRVFEVHFCMCMHNLLKREVIRLGNSAITVSSVTYALRGQKILRSIGIKAEVKKTVKHDGEKSCSYSLIVKKEKVDEAEQILLRNGVRVMGRSEGDGEK